MPSTSSTSRTSARGSGCADRSGLSAETSDSTWRTAVTNVPSPIMPTGRRSRSLKEYVRSAGSHSTTGAIPGSVPAGSSSEPALRERARCERTVPSSSGSERRCLRTTASSTRTPAITTAGASSSGSTTHAASSSAAAISSSTSCCNWNEPSLPTRPFARPEAGPRELRAGPWGAGGPPGPGAAGRVAFPAGRVRVAEAVIPAFPPFIGPQLHPYSACPARGLGGRITLPAPTPPAVSRHSRGPVRHRGPASRPGTTAERRDRFLCRAGRHGRRSD